MHCIKWGKMGKIKWSHRTIGIDFDRIMGNLHTYEHLRNNYYTNNGR